WPLQHRACLKYVCSKCEGASLATASRAFFLGGEPRKVDLPLFPRFFSCLSLPAADQLQQTTSSPAEIDIVARGKSFPFCHKTPPCCLCLESTAIPDVPGRVRQRRWPRDPR